VAFPGAYKKDDPTLTVNLYNVNEVSHPLFYYVGVRMESLRACGGQVRDVRLTKL
jgi:hypothetical protein